MPETHKGALEIKKAVLAKNPNHYQEIGKMGGQAPHKSRPFRANPELARRAGARGGRVKSYATACYRGHPYEEGSFYVYVNPNTGARQRKCKPCFAARKAEKRGVVAGRLHV